MTEKAQDAIVAFGMNSQQISEAVVALSKHKDNNHPTKSGAYDDFLKVVDKGHKTLLAQEDYGQIN